MTRLTSWLETVLAHKNLVVISTWVIVLLIVGFGEVVLSDRNWVRRDDFLWNLVMYGLIVFATVTSTWILLAKPVGVNSHASGDSSPAPKS